MYHYVGKRVFDFTTALVGLLLLAPVLIFLILAVRIKLGTPVLFRQKRPGLRGKGFVLVKLRTMTDARDAAGELLPNAERLTSFGQFLRSSSLDELPELWNVLKGEMSLVGPRPLMMGYLPYYTAEESRRHNVRPGITGWAQVNGRNAVGWDERFRLDLEYVDRCSFLFDLKILALTVLTVFRREGISAEGHATMPSLIEVRAPRSDSASSRVNG